MTEFAMKTLTVLGILLFILGAESSADCVTPLSATLFLTGLFIMKLCNGYWFN